MWLETFLLSALLGFFLFAVVVVLEQFDRHNRFKPQRKVQFPHTASDSQRQRTRRALNDSSKSSEQLWAILHRKKEELVKNPVLFHVDVEALRSAVPSQLDADVWQIICQMIEPQCATECELAEFGAETRRIFSMLSALMADVILDTGGYFIRGFKHVIMGLEEWNEFVTSSGYHTLHYHVLESVFEIYQGLVPTTQLLTYLLPESDELKMQQLMKPSFNGSLLTAAALFDIKHKEHWRIAAMHELCPNIEVLKWQRNKGLLPFHEAVVGLVNGEYTLQANDNNWQRALSRLLPRDLWLLDKCALRQLYADVDIEGNGIEYQRVSYDEWVAHTCFNNIVLGSFLLQWI